MTYKMIVNQVILQCIGQIPEGNGSGVVWDDKGHIVTNYHGKNYNYNYYYFISKTISIKISVKRSAHQDI